MAFEAGAITGKISLDREPATQAIGGVIEDVKRFKQAVDGNMAGVKEAMGEAAEEGGGKFHKMLEGLKAEYGKKSLLGESFELLAGGGAIAGLSIFSEQVKNIVGGVADLAAQYKEGEISGGEMVDGILKSIPVFGGLYEAASKVVDVIDGQAEAERDLAKETAKENVELAEWQKRLEHIQQEKEVVAELTKEFRLLGVTLDQAFQLDGMKGVAREVAEIKFQATNAVSGITGKISDAFDTSIKQDQDAVDHVKASLNALQQQFEIDKEAFAVNGGVHWASMDALPGKIQNAQKVLELFQNDLKRDQGLKSAALSAAQPDIDKINSNASAAQARVLNDAWENLKSGIHGIGDAIQQGVRDKIAQAAEEMRKAGKDMADNLRTPMEVYNAKIKEAQNLFQHGYIDDKTFARASLNDYKDLLDSQKAPQNRQIDASQLQLTKYVTANDVPAPITETAKNTAKMLDALFTLVGIGQDVVKQAEKDVIISLP